MMTSKLALITLAFLLAGCSSESVDSTPVAGDSTPSARANASNTAVKVTLCKLNSFGGLDIKYDLRNTSKETSDFLGQIEILNAKGDRIDEAGIVESKVKAGQTVHGTTGGTKMEAGAYPKGFKCAAKDLTRVASQ